MEFSQFKAGMREVFSNKVYVAIGLIGSLSIFLLTIYLNNIQFSNYIIGTSDFTFGEKVALFSEIVRGLPQSTEASFLYTLPFIVFLFGVNVSLIAYTFKNVTLSKGSAASGGVMAAILGIGCPACGSAVISVVGLGGVLTFLPFGGAEFSFLSILLMAGSAYWIGKNVECKSCKIQ